MPRQRKEYSPISIKMDKAVFARLQGYSEESGVPKTTVIERAVMDYIEQHQKSEQARAKNGQRA